MARYPGARTFSFGDSPALIAELTGLVRKGVKRATCTAVADIEAGREAAPEIGRRDIALGPYGAPALVIETQELIETTWAGMTEEMALAEGEDDSLESWRAGHRRYYTRQGIFAEDMQLIWERFTVIEDFEESGDV
ncbi:ASCH domain-containing protein [Sulfitobacter albidus]|nr:ASCH domain-containing protein [Sulfitobacter albidus]